MSNNIYEIYEKIKTTIKKANKILITAHEKPDGDALGSVFAMAKYLDSLHKKHQIFLEDNSYFQQQTILVNIISYDNIDWKNIDLIITLDSSNLKRTSLKLTEIGVRKIINIDHHISNNYFGYLNLVDDISSSTTLILTKMFNYFDFKINNKIAKALLSGILTDTDNFSNKGTNSEAFEVAAELLKTGASLTKFNFNKADKNIKTLKIWGNSFQRLCKNNKVGNAYTIITKEEIETVEKKNLRENIEDLVNFFNNLKDSKFTMVLKEQDNGVKVSLRTTNNNIDVARIATFFGGGGHKKAAGFFIKGKIVKEENSWQIKG